MGAAAVGSFRVYDTRIRSPFCVDIATERTKLDHARLKTLASVPEPTDELAVTLVELACRLFKEAAPFTKGDELFWNLEALAGGMRLLQKAGDNSRALCERAWTCDLSLLEEGDRRVVSMDGLFWEKGRFLSYAEMQNVASIGERAFFCLKRANQERLFQEFVAIYRGLAEPEKAFSLAERCRLPLEEELAAYFTRMRQIFYTHDSLLPKREEAMLVGDELSSSTSTRAKISLPRVIEVPKPTFWAAFFCSS